MDLATKALEMKPGCFEAYYARARAKRDSGTYAEALLDLVEALRLAPRNRELQRLLSRVQEEVEEQQQRSATANSSQSVSSQEKDTETQDL